MGSSPDQGLNPRLLHWQTESLPLSHQGSSGKIFKRDSLTQLLQVLQGHTAALRLELRALEFQTNTYLRMGPGWHDLGAPLNTHLTDHRGPKKFTYSLYFLQLIWSLGERFSLPWVMVESSTLISLSPMKFKGYKWKRDERLEGPLFSILLSPQSLHREDTQWWSMTPSRHSPALTLC